MKILIALMGLIAATGAFAEDVPSVTERVSCADIQAMISELSAIEEPTDDEIAELENLKIDYRSKCARSAAKRKSSALKNTVVAKDVQHTSVPVVKSETVSTPMKTVQKTEKISSDPSKKLPKITGRSSSKFSWPVRGKILSAYGAKSNGLFNDGINISAKQGTAVMAAENGVVAYAGNEVKGMGNLIIIQHSDGWMTVYAHMDSMTVKRGTRVNVGQKIGTVGKTGKVDSSQLHFEIRKGTKAYNPSSYLKK
jgi:murein DD-endopeptidase MepM/ murein hydrolase activator NlpD